MIEQLSDEELYSIISKVPTLDSNWQFIPELEKRRLRAIAHKAEQEMLRQVVEEMGLNCYLVWAEVDGEYKQNLCLTKDWVDELKKQVESE